MAAELLHDLFRRAGRRQQPEPGAGIELRDRQAGFGESRHLGQSLDALGRRHGERTYIAIVDIALGQRRAEIERDISGDHILQGWLVSAIGYVPDRNPAFESEELA